MSLALKKRKKWEKNFIVNTQSIVVDLSNMIV